MIRKTLIIVCTGASIAFLCVWMVSMIRPLALSSAEVDFELRPFRLKAFAGDGRLSLTYTRRHEWVTCGWDEGYVFELPPRPKEFYFELGRVYFARNRSCFFEENFDYVAVLSRTEIVDVPLLVIALLLGLYPASVLARSIRTRRRQLQPNRCSHCGYNLTGTTSGVCPECATRVER